MELGLDRSQRFGRMAIGSDLAPLDDRRAELYWRISVQPAPFVKGGEAPQIAFLHSAPGR